MTAPPHETMPPLKPRIQEEPWGRMEWLVEQRPGGTDPGLSLAVMTVKPGHQAPRHRHANCTEVLSVTGGRLRSCFGDEVIDAAPGDSVLVPKGCPHAAENPGPTDASALIAYSAGRRHYQLLSSNG